jgi:hypothetical protein
MGSSGAGRAIFRGMSKPKLGMVGVGIVGSVTAGIAGSEGDGSGISGIGNLMFRLGSKPRLGIVGTGTEGNAIAGIVGSVGEGSGTSGTGRAISLEKQSALIVLLAGCPAAEPLLR